MQKNDLLHHVRLSANELIDIRRHLHKYPELSFQEVKTAEFVSSVLSKWGVPHEKGMVGTGIVGLLKGENPQKKCIALRADLDALPITEENNVSYKSENVGVMHACGHDVHTTCLLGAIKALHNNKHAWEGSIKFIFQPGEERIPGGAKLMIEAGVLENPKPDKMIGLHVLPQMKTGFIGIKEGMAMASADEIYIRIIGKGGHAALPHLATDVILCSAHLIVSLQQVVSRNANPIIPTVLSFGKIQGNGATNVLPESVSLEGTFRTFDENWRGVAHERIKRICDSVAESFEVKIDLEIKRGYPYLINDQHVTSEVKKALRELWGDEQVLEMEARMTAEDFAYYSQHIPACFFRLGTAGKNGEFNQGLHTPTFNVDEESILIGAASLAYAAITI